MILRFGSFSSSFAARKIFLYFFGYCFLFLLTHLALISLVSFFHFLLDHEMAVIEDWLYRNAWELIICAKLVSAFLITKALKLNNYSIVSLFYILKSERWIPNKRAILFTVFIAVFFYALILVINKDGLISNQKISNFTYISFFGSCLFYFIDFIVITNLFHNINISGKKKHTVLLFSLVVAFLLTTRAALPYNEKYYDFVALHFITLMIFLIKEKVNILNPIIYTAIVIGPFSSVYGLDIVWDNSHSIYYFKQSLPFLGIIGVWLVGLTYYLKR